MTKRFLWPKSQPGPHLGVKAPKPDQAFRFKWELIEPGDVICSTIPENSISKTIRMLTWSDFSHVSLCVEPRGCVEANENVARFSLLRIGCLDRKNVKILRLRDDLVRSHDIRLAAAKSGIMFLGQPYWTEGAFRALFKMRSPARQPGAFCSHLVAKAYEAAGLNIIPGVPPEHITPAHIAKSQLFYDISDTVLELISSAYIQPEMEYLDAERALDTPHLVENALGIAICRDIAANFEELAEQAPRSLLEAQMIVASFNQGNPQLAHQLDKFLTESLSRHHFVDEMLRIMPCKPFYDPDQLAAWLMSDGATPANVSEVLRQCKELDARSDFLLQEQLHAIDVFTKITDDYGYSFAIPLAKVEQELFDKYSKLTLINRACINMLEAFQTEGDFISFAPSGDPHERLTKAADAIGTFILQAHPPDLPAKQYHGRLRDCLYTYVNSAGRSDTGMGVSVWQVLDGEREFLPPPPLDEGSWKVNPFNFPSERVEDQGEIESDDGQNP